MDKEHFRVTVHCEVIIKKATTQQTKILVFFLDRLHVLSQPGGNAKLPHQLERCVPFLDLRRIRVPETNACRIEFGVASPDGSVGDGLQFSCSLENDCAKIVAHVTACLRMHLPQVGNRLVEVSLPNRWMLEVLIAELGTSLVQSQAISDKCGHFASAYDLYSSYLGVTAQPEIKWDVDTIYFSQGTHTFCLRDFSDSKQEEFSAVLGALAFNDYFNGLDCSGVRLSDSFFIKSVGFLLTYNVTLNQLLLSGCNLKNDFLRAFASAVEKNSGLKLTDLDLSDNKFDGDDKGVPENLAQILAHQSSTLEKLNLARCGLLMKRLNRCFELLTDRLIGFQSLPLRHLCIDGCGGLGGSGMGGGVGLENYLSRLGSLEHLSCVDCGLVLEPLTPVLLKLTHRLTHLDLSRNQYCPTAQAGHEHPAGLFNKFVRKPSITSKTADDASNGAASTATAVNRLDIWAELFAECRSLRLVRLNRCRLPAAAAESLLIGLSRCGGGGGGDSAKPAELSVELAGNDFGVSGAQILWNCFNNYQMPQLESLDLSDNDFGAGTNPLVDSIRKSSVRHLSIGGNNFRGFAKKDQSMIQEFSELVTEDKCRLTSLSIRGAKLERNLCVLLNALGECNNLTRLDISDNGAGELSAKVLAKALFVNSSLVVLQLDGNRIGAKGLRDIAESLRFNQTLLRLPVPVADVAASAGGSQQQQQLVQEALDLLQEGLVRNNQKVGRQVTAKDYRLHAELSNYQFTADNQIASASVSLAAVASVAAAPETGRAEIDEHAERCRRQ
ncbi:hypothetical protein BOX15_Mlig027574g9 [Macrostomum lignano]|uniref:Carm_PH domain-containing protein n=1 Tax=Macrostomum lignano TaxID=282301 RepID=A0A267FNX7_9PLAT|nr:hypothetical protein BOX15_Mlig027574g9 [Macrostomum lignano]